MMSLPEYIQPPLSVSLDRLVFRAVWVYDLDRGNDNLRRQVLTCFCKEIRVTSLYLDCIMPQIFEVVEEQMDVLKTEWDESLTQDEVENAIHDGLIFSARVLRRYGRYLPPTRPIHPRELW